MNTITKMENEKKKKKKKPGEMSTEVTQPSSKISFCVGPVRASQKCIFLLKWALIMLWLLSVAKSLHLEPAKMVRVHACWLRSHSLMDRSWLPVASFMSLRNFMPNILSSWPVRVVFNI